MGAWGSGPFENDGAMDFVGAVAAAGRTARPALFRSAFATVIDNGDRFLDGDDAAPAVAAAALVAAELAGRSFAHEVGMPEGFGSGDVLDVPADFPVLALRALDRVAGEQSELRMLWEDGDSPFRIAAMLRPIRSVLSNAARLKGQHGSTAPEGKSSAGS